MSEKYGRTPSEIVFPDGRCSLMESQLFNLFILQTGLEEQNRITKAKK